MVHLTTFDHYETDFPNLLMADLLINRHLLVPLVQFLHHIITKKVFGWEFVTNIGQILVYVNENLELISDIKFHNRH